MQKHLQHRRAFTLAELLVALGAVAILTVGIGRIFGSVNQLVTTGSAVAEVEQVARTLEERMRRDFQLLNRMETDRAFMAIRMREFGSPERPIYLTSEDREMDIRDGIAPYDEDADSRAIYTRIDEIIFLAGDGDDSFQSRQLDGAYSNDVVRAGYARLYYGHGLRPKLDNEWPPEPAYPDSPSAKRIPERQYERDGFLAQPPGSDTSALHTSSNNNIYGRNQYAADWPLVRHPLLLVGGRASGPNSQIIDGLPLNTAIGHDREYAPFIRDTETFSRIWPELNGLTVNDLHVFGNNEDWADPRAIYHGRVDVAAQTLDDVIRFLMGEPHRNQGGVATAVGAASRAYPFEIGVGRLGENPIPGAVDEVSGEFSNKFAALQRPLWRWPDEASGSTSQQMYAQTLKGIRSAIAGIFVRPLVETTPQPVDRITETNRLDVEGAEDAFMDTHAVIGPRCSRFEIAWSDGSRAKQDIDIDSDGVPEYRNGDVIWFDITRVRDDDDNNGTVDRRTHEFMYFNFASSIDFVRNYQLPLITPNPNAGFIPSPEIPWSRRDILLEVATGATQFEPVGAATTNSFAPLYNPDITGGVPLQDDAEDAFEHFAIWPFLDAKSSGAGFPESNALGSRTWPKPSLIRVRTTLHDSGGRLAEGRKYEFIFSIDLDD